MKNVNYKVAFAVCAALLLLTEFFLRLSTPRLLGQSRGIPLVSSELLDDRLEQLRKSGNGKRTLLFLGDSVAWGSALKVHQVSRWKGKTPGAFLEAALPSSWRLVELSADGLLMSDFVALLARAQILKPDAVVVELNYRMLGPEAGDPASAYSRSWLRPNAPLKTFGEKTESFLRKHCVLFRDAEFAAALVFGASLQDCLTGMIGSIFPNEQDEDTAEAMLDLKLRPYYTISAQAPEHPAFLALKAMKSILSETGKPALVFLTPQNADRVSAYLDSSGYKTNRKLLASTAAPLHYVDWSARKPGGFFFDHCHLDEVGNRGLATWILEELKL